jgi:hypothetical protein
MRNAKKSEEIAANLALFRLASRELEGISANVEMFASHIAGSGSLDSEIAKIFNAMAKMGDKADKMRAKLDRDLEPFAEIQIQEIY